MQERTKIAYNNYDIIFRHMTEQFKNKALDFYGIKTAPIVRVEPTDLPTITVNDRRMDFMFLLADDTYLHLEFQTTYHEKDLDRFLQYDVSAYERYQKPIHTVIIYGANIESACTSKNYGSVSYKTDIILMKEYDGDQVLLNLWTKIENGEKLTEIDELHLMFVPLMKSEANRSERAIETVELVKRIDDEDQQIKLMAAIIAISDKFIDKEYVEKLMEVLHMARVMRLAEERAEIRIQQDNIVSFLQGRFGMDVKQIQEEVKKIIEIDALNSLLYELYRISDRQKAIELIEAAVGKQNRSR
ncbi:hypothetical protein [Bacillus sp. FJAT-45037]|uniref:hypothetical protein n=1 Tax=Bacillus sp. FJAT-45037 TaxID=2011007 RepID=UPI000C24A38C|nr:hypothetical protein [Bacillus sp. FJAT-45037]